MFCSVAIGFQTIHEVSMAGRRFHFKWDRKGGFRGTQHKYGKVYPCLGLVYQDKQEPHLKLTIELGHYF